MKEEYQDKAQKVLNNLLNMIQANDFPEKLARTMILPRTDADAEKPSSKWSLANRMIMLAAGTEDARGYEQWRKAGRHVKAGAKAFYIVAPRTITREEPDPENPDELRKVTILTGFLYVPVFRFEDTEGAELPTVDYRPPVLPPLYEVAAAYGVSVKYLPAAPGQTCYGEYSLTGKTIRLYTHDVITFFHELAHAADDQLHGIIGGQQQDQEIVAETVAAALCALYGYQGYVWEGVQYVASYYVGQYSDDPHLALKGIMRYFSRIEEVLGKILTDAERLSSQAKAS